MITQKEAVMIYLHKHGSITPIKAFKHLGITKLATVVSDLIRKDGVNIIKEDVKVKTRYGWTIVKKYSLPKGEKLK